uniref:Uncharacterized protein n=1 Tax=Romanomermis culicivorax TaxID=13658 RepID=A0A915HHC4_ROMCU
MKTCKLLSKQDVTSAIPRSFTVKPDIYLSLMQLNFSYAFCRFTGCLSFLKSYETFKLPDVRKNPVWVTHATTKKDSPNDYV